MINIFLLGKFCIETNKSKVHKIETHKAEELIVYLLLYRDKPHSREQLADVLWGGISSEQSKSYLRKTLWQLHSGLETFPGQNLLLTEGDWLQINPKCNFWLDIAILENVFKTTQGVRGKDLKGEEFREIQKAVDLYKGELLDGWYQDWCLYEREHFQYLYLALLDKLVGYCEKNELYEKGLIFGERILHHDRAHERTHRRLMRLHYLAGDRTSALRQFQKCVESLRNELDVEPAESTNLLVEMIRNDQLELSYQAIEKGSQNINQKPLKMALNHLNIIQNKLNQMQVQLTQDIQAIQKTLRQDQP